jgi:hypothetical protein
MAGQRSGASGLARSGRGGHGLALKFLTIERKEADEGHDFVAVVEELV